MPWMRSTSIEMTVRYMFCTGPAAGRDSAPEASAKRPFPPPACQPVWSAVLMRFCNLSHVICIIPGGSRFVNPGIFSFTAALQDLQFCLLHVIAYHLLATAEAHLSFACHCEERGGRLATWQSVSPRKYLTSCLPFGRIRRWLQICLRHYFLPCCTARRTDCPVAPLLAMTCRSLLPVRNARTPCQGQMVTPHVFTPYRRNYGLSRRFVPCNDMQGTGMCPSAVHTPWTANDAICPPAADKLGKSQEDCPCIVDSPIYSTARISPVVEMVTT